MSKTMLHKILRVVGVTTILVAAACVISPGLNDAFQWEIGHKVSLTNNNDLGIGAKSLSGAASADPKWIDIDGFENTDVEVAALHAKGYRVVCYIEVGALETGKTGRPDAAKFPKSAIGNCMPGYCNTENYINIKDPTVQELIRKRIDMCQQKGFDAVEPDLDDSFSVDEGGNNGTGFNLTLQDGEDYFNMLAAYAHGLNVTSGTVPTQLGFILKNGQNIQFITDMAKVADWALVEQCAEQDGFQAGGPLCGAYAAFTSKSKAVWAVEYTTNASDRTKACNILKANKFVGEIQNLDLDGTVAVGGRIPCQ